MKKSRNISIIQSYLANPTHIKKGNRLLDKDYRYDNPEGLLVKIPKSKRPRSSYVYVFYTRTTGIPIYVGKGSDSRASSYNSRVKNEDFRTLVAAEGVDIRFELQGVTERQAFRTEISLIKKYGRLHLGTGTLLNISEGGHGGSQGVTRSEETRKLISDTKKGNNHPNSDKTIWTWYHKNGELIQATAWEMNQLKFNNSRSKAGELIKVFEGGTIYNGKRLYQINGWRLFPELPPRKKAGQAAGRTHYRVSDRIFRWQHVSGITESLTVRFLFISLQEAPANEK